MTDGVLWDCESPFCLRKPGWWRSRYGVIGCLQCNPVTPDNADAIVATGTMQDAPMVHRTHRSTPVDVAITAREGLTK